MFTDAEKLDNLLEEKTGSRDPKLLVGMMPSGAVAVEYEIDSDTTIVGIGYDLSAALRKLADEVDAL